MRISSIDVGSNAIRQVIVEVNPHGQWTTLKKFRAPLRLGNDVFSSGRIQTHTEIELLNVFKKMQKLNKKYKVEKVIALATSAMRDAKNGPAIKRKIKKISQISLQTISGQKEAELIRASIFKSQIINFNTSLLIDIGGGSAEFSTLVDQKIVSSQSFPLGVVRLLNLTKKTKKSVAQIAKPYLLQVKNKNKIKKIDIAIGTGGNFDALSKLKLQLLKKSPNTNLTVVEIQTLLKIWNSMTLLQKEKLNIRKDRIDVLALAIELILETLMLFKIEKVKIPLTGLKEGAIYSFIK
jgi:exopolyphosphatase/guanosine-5'-triphosphate,3'-diphosphate pyrophosphatase